MEQINSQSSAEELTDLVELTGEAASRGCGRDGGGGWTLGEPAYPDSFAPVSAAEALTMALSLPQQKAIELLTSGHSMVAAATAAGVNRSTLHRWLKGDAAFVAAFNAWQRDVLATARGRLLALSDLAVTTVAKAMTRGDTKTAVAVLKSLGVMDHAVPGSTDPQEVERQQAMELRKAKIARQKEEFQLDTDEMTGV